MIIPRSFTIGQREWQVRQVPAPMHLRGYAMPEARVMQINPRCTPKQQAKTFWHEVTHAVLHDMGDPRWKDEKFVDEFGRRLAEVVRTAELPNG